MRALVVTKLGDPTLPLSDDGPLTLMTKQPVPAMVPNGVRIKVTAAALNFADALQVQASARAHKTSFPVTAAQDLQEVLRQCPGCSVVCLSIPLPQALNCVRQPPSAGSTTGGLVKGLCHRKRHVWIS
jgi:hypothetical protein